MPVKSIINGFFRSGTTLLWKLIRDSSYDSICLYEPDHPFLAYHLKNYEIHKKMDPLHKLPVWEDYFKLDMPSRQKICLENPFTKDKFAPSPSSINDYVNKIDKLDEKIILQTNRFHFALGEIKTNKKIKKIHIVRNPYDVFKSINRNYLLGKKGIIRLIKLLVKPIYKSSSMGIDKMVSWIASHTGVPMGLARPGIKPIIFLRYSFFELFIICWIVSNYHALISINENMDMCISYEKLVTETKNVLKDISSYLNIDDLNEDLVIKKQCGRLPLCINTRIISIVKKHNLQQEWDYISSIIPETINTISF